MMNTMDFGAGLDLTGSWENIRTGEVINIRDTIMMDNQMIGLTTDGRKIPFENLQSFVKSDIAKPNTPPKRTNISQKRTPRPSKPFFDDVDREQNWGTKDNADSSTDSGYEILPEDMDLLRKPLPRKEGESKIQKSESELPNPISTVLDGLKKSEQPKINFNIKWDNIPEGIIFLKKYLQISENDITDAIINKFINVNDIRDKLTSDLKKIIEVGLNPEKKKTKNE